MKKHSNMKKPDSQWLISVPFEDIKVGQTALISRKILKKDINAFALLTGDVNPLHCNIQYAKKSRFKNIIAHGLYAETLISAVLGTILPGPGTIFLEQTVEYRKPVYVNDTIYASVKVISKRAKHKIVFLESTCMNQHNEIILEGIATVMVPKKQVKVRRPKENLNG